MNDQMTLDEARDDSKGRDWLRLVIRYETALTYGRLCKHPDHQAEAIAKHYTDHATIALQLLKMLECRRHAGGYAELDRSIQILVGKIKTNHRHDLGIELEWPNNPSSTTNTGK